MSRRTFRNLCILLSLISLCQAYFTYNDATPSLSLSFQQPPTFTPTFMIAIESSRWLVVSKENRFSIVYQDGTTSMPLSLTDPNTSIYYSLASPNANCQGAAQIQGTNYLIFGTQLTGAGFSRVDYVSNSLSSNFGAGCFSKICDYVLLIKTDLFVTGKELTVRNAQDGSIWFTQTTLKTSRLVAGPAGALEFFSVNDLGTRTSRFSIAYTYHLLIITGVSASEDLNYPSLSNTNPFALLFSSTFNTLIACYSSQCDGINYSTAGTLWSLPLGAFTTTPIVASLALSTNYLLVGSASLDAWVFSLAASTAPSLVTALPTTLDSPLVSLGGAAAGGYLVALKNSSLTFYPKTWPCEPPCSTCTAQTNTQCLSCLSGFELASSSCVIIVCDQTCATCAGSSPAQCSSCLPGRILSGTPGTSTCNAYSCDPTCSTCEGPTATQCLTCDETTRTFNSQAKTCDALPPSPTIDAVCYQLLKPVDQERSGCVECFAEEQFVQNGKECANHDGHVLFYNWTAEVEWREAVGQNTSTYILVVSIHLESESNALISITKDSNILSLLPLDAFVIKLSTKAHNNPSKTAAISYNDTLKIYQIKTDEGLVEAPTFNDTVSMEIEINNLLNVRKNVLFEDNQTNTTHLLIGRSIDSEAKAIKNQSTFQFFEDFKLGASLGLIGILSISVLGSVCTLNFGSALIKLFQIIEIIGKFEFISVDYSEILQNCLTTIFQLSDLISFKPDLLISRPTITNTRSYNKLTRYKQEKNILRSTTMFPLIYLFISLLAVVVRYIKFKETVKDKITNSILALKIFIFEMNIVDFTFYSVFSLMGEWNLLIPSEVLSKLIAAFLLHQTTLYAIGFIQLAFQLNKSLPKSPTKGIQRKDLWEDHQLKIMLEDIKVSCRVKFHARCLNPLFTLRIMLFQILVPSLPHLPEGSLLCLLGIQACFSIHFLYVVLRFNPFNRRITEINSLAVELSILSFFFSSGLKIYGVYHPYQDYMVMSLIGFCMAFQFLSAIQETIMIIYICKKKPLKRPSLTRNRVSFRGMNKDEVSNSVKVNKEARKKSLIEPEKIILEKMSNKSELNYMNKKMKIPDSETVKAKLVNLKKVKGAINLDHKQEGKNFEPEKIIQDSPRIQNSLSPVIGKNEAVKFNRIRPSSPRAKLLKSPPGNKRDLILISKQAQESTQKEKPILLLRAETNLDKQSDSPKRLPQLSKYNRRHD